MKHDDFDFDAAVKRRMQDLIEQAGSKSQPVTLDLRVPGKDRRWRLAELAIEYWNDEVSERTMDSMIAALDDEAALGRIVARELRDFLERIVRQEDDEFSLEERADIDYRATQQDIEYDRMKYERWEAA